MRPDAQGQGRVRFDFSGRVTLVTGVASPTGIGRAILRGFAAAGATVAGTDIDAEGLRELQAEFPGGHFGRVDSRNSEEVRDFFASICARFGGVDILVNNAGVAPFAPILDLSEEDWDRTFDTNVRGYFLFAQAFGRHLARRGTGGAIVNVASISVHVSGENKVHYCASKAAVGSLTKGLALEFSRHGIRVNSVEPGTIDTRIVADQPGIQRLVEAARDNPRLPINRLGRGDDLVGATLFLCSDAASYITGSAILVDGGDLAGNLSPTPQGNPA
jgi:NAD(P)-dependent dehydrogenase (short-subunit alcohol dehydrogenase family)